MRPSKDKYYLNIAKDVAKRSSCLKSCYGAVIVKNDEIVSTGYNGAPRGRKNCTECGYCIRKDLNIPSGCRYEICRSVHAEANAIISASRNDMIDGTLYLSGFKYYDGSLIQDIDCCAMCKRLIINSGIKKVVFDGDPIRTVDVNAWVLIDDTLPVKNEAYYRSDNLFQKWDPPLPKLDLVKRIPDIYNKLPEIIKNKIPEYTIETLKKWAVNLLLFAKNEETYSINTAMVQLGGFKCINLLFYLLEDYREFINLIYDNCDIDGIKDILRMLDKD